MTKLDEVKELIENGFDDLELIAFELDIPIELVRQCKREVQDSKQSSVFIQREEHITKSVQKRVNTIDNGFDEETYKAHVKMNKLRDRFSELFEGEKKKEKSGANKTVSLREIEAIKARMEKSTGKVEKRIITQFAEAIESRQRECTDIQELQYLLSMITKEVVKGGPVFVDGIRGRISNKITKLQQQQAIDRMRNDIPTSIDSIISSLVSGKIDMQKANTVIDEEAKRKVASSPKTKFALSEEAQRRQIILQIKTVLVEKANTYPVQVPGTVIQQLQQLCGVEQEEAIRVVVRNCIGRKDYQTARSVCDKNDVKNEYGFTVRNIASLRDEINNAEFGDIVLQGINNARTHEEERAYIEMIERALNLGHIRLGAVSLGKSRDGLKNITLADIWEDGKTKQTKYR